MSGDKKSDTRKTPNFFTIDIEEWFHANYESVDTSKHTIGSSTLPHVIDTLIDEMARYQVSATCFIVGAVAKEYPDMVKRLVNAGHEIASHSMHHRLVHTLTPVEHTSFPDARSHLFTLAKKNSLVLEKVHVIREGTVVLFEIYQTVDHKSTK